jgi:hypothetical protein
VFKYARQVRVCHSNKEAVATILNKPKGKRKEEFLLLRQSAITKHNISFIVKGEGQGEIIFHYIFVACLCVVCVYVLYAFGRPLAEFDETGLDGSGRAQDSY